MKTLRLVNDYDTITIVLNEVTPLLGAQISLNEFTISEYSPRVGVQSRYGKSGGVATGDRNVNSRTIGLSLDITATNDISYRECLSQILSFFHPDNGDVYLYDDQDDYTGTDKRALRAHVELNTENLRVKERGNYMRVMGGSIELVMLDGFWETADADTFLSDSGGVADLGTFIISNNSDFRAFPVYTLTALDDISLFRITNQTTGVFIEVGSNDFITGKEMSISTITGDILIDGVNVAASSLSDGSSFPDIMPGINTFEYSSAYGSCVISAEWRTRWPR